MKLKEIIEKLDKSYKNSCSVHLSELAHSEFDIHNYLNEDDSKITAYFFLNWQLNYYRNLLLRKLKVFLLYLIIFWKKHNRVIRCFSV